METRGILAFGAIILFILVVSNFTLTASKYLDFWNDNAPTKISITLLEGCDECVSLDSIVASIKSKDVVVKADNTKDFATSKEVASDYGIDKLPAVIVEGDINKLSLSGFRTEVNTLVYESQTAPYVELPSGDVVGIIEILYIDDSECEVCRGFEQILGYLESEGVYVSTIVNFEHDTAEEIINEYSIEFLPTMIILGDIDAYPSVNQALISISETVDSALVISALPPYKQISDGRIRGGVDMVYLRDANCTDCYDVELHKVAIENLGIYLSSESNVDISSVEGQNYVSEYNITSVPTIILMGDLEVYDGFEGIWNSVGTIETDGTHVFRNMGALGDVKYQEI